MNYLLSIIVPTKNRYKYLKSIIESFIDMNNDKVELVIQDNSDENEELVQYLNNFNSDNIRYCYIKNHISVSENFNEGVLNSNGKYVCMLGDDDAVSSKIVDIVQFMEEKGIESAIFNKAKYFWPDMEFHTHRLPSLIIPKHSGNIVYINPQKELERCLRKGATSLMNLPEIYHGVVKRSTLNLVFDKCGTYFPGASPDMAIAIALSLVVKSHVYVDAPYTISGQAHNSAGGKGARHEHKGNLKEIKWLPDCIEENWEKKIPKVWTGPTIYAESAHKALRSMGREDLVNDFNYSYQYAWFLSFNPDYKMMLDEIIKDNIYEKVKIFLYSAIIFVRRSIYYVKNIGGTRLNLSYDSLIKDIETSKRASTVVDDNIIDIKFTTD